MKTRALVVMALLLGASGCKESVAFTPASSNEIRAAVRQVDANGDFSMLSAEESASGLVRGRDPSKPAPPPARLHDASGEAHDVDSNTVLRMDVADGTHADYGLGNVSYLCRTTKACPLDDASARWELDVGKLVPDYGRIARWSAGVLLAGALVTGNVVCFGLDKCGTQGKVLVGFGDGVLVVSAAVVLVIVLVGASLRD